MELVSEIGVRITGGRLGLPSGGKIMILSRRPSATSERHNYTDYIVLTEMIHFRKIIYKNEEQSYLYLIRTSSMHYN